MGLAKMLTFAAVLGTACSVGPQEASELDVFIKARVA